MKSLTRHAILVLSLLTILAGCNLFGPSPKDVLSQYLDSYYKGDFAKSYEKLSSSDKSTKSQQEFAESFGGYGTLMKAAAGKVSFVVKDVKVTGNKAVATVDVTSPDLSSFAGDFMGAAFRSAFGGQDSRKELDKAIAERLKSKDLPMATNTEEHELIKDKDGWRVYLGWEHLKKIAELKKQAEKLEKQKKFAEAKAKYGEVLSLVRDAEASKKQKEMDDKIAKYKDIQAYLPSVEVRNISVGKGFLGDTGVFGEVKNKGDKTLKKVEVTAYCLDKSGTVVFEKSYSPILVSEYSYSMRGNKPLKPNYSEQFGFKVNEAPSDWSGKVKVEVTDLEFE